MELNLLEFIGNNDVTKQDAIITLNYWQKYFGGKGLFGIVRDAYLFTSTGEDRYIRIELRVYEAFETGQGKQVDFIIYYRNGRYLSCVTMLNDTSIATECDNEMA